MRRSITRVLLLLPLLISSFPSSVHAATVTASSCSQSAVQTAVNSAANGDTVAIPAGSCSWSGAVAWTNKNIAVVGAGKDVTTINCGACFQIASNVSTSQFSQWRLSGMTLAASTPAGITIKVTDDNSSSHTGWRIHNMKLNKPGAGSGYGIFVSGPSYGLIDHNDFIWGGGLAIIAASLLNSEWPGSSSAPQGGYLASQPLDMGTANAIYIEDNTFTGTQSGGFAAYDTSSGGARAVFRYNTVTGGYYYSHWTRNVEIGGILHEIYNNKFVGSSAYNMYPIRLESGTGAIFNNTVTGYSGNYALLDERRGFYENGGSFGACDGTKPWDGNKGDPAAPGWPCLGQIGRGPGKTMAQIQAGDKQPSVPLYIWNNGPEDGCRAGGTCANTFGVQVWDGSTASRSYVRGTPHPNGEVDYVLNGKTPKPGYTPYVYPHPLQGTTSANPPPPAEPTLAAPTNLRLVP